jgi:hypothetical protein
VIFADANDSLATGGYLTIAEQPAGDADLTPPNWRC